MNFYCDITKVNDEERIVEGYASTEAMDVQGEIVKIEAIVEALPEYMKFGNIREMHQPSAVGKAVSAEVNEKGLYLSVKVVDDSAWAKVKEGVYNGFSIGGKSLSKIGDTISKLRLTEISLVDRPANPEAIFNLWKGDGMEKEVEVEATIVKGMYSVSWLADIIGQLDCLQMETEWEKEWEKDGSTIPEELKAQIKALSGTLTAMVAEEIAEIVGEEKTIEMSESIEDIAKAGATISKTNKAMLQSIIDACTEMMGDAEKSEEAEDIQKVDGEVDIQKAFSLQAEEIKKMAGRIEELEAMPSPSKGAVMSIAKGAEAETIAKAPETVQDMIKMAHQTGGVRVIL